MANKVSIQEIYKDMVAHVGWKADLRIQENSRSLSAFKSLYGWTLDSVRMEENGCGVKILITRWKSPNVGAKKVLYKPPFYVRWIAKVD